MKKIVEIKNEKILLQDVNRHVLRRQLQVFVRNFSQKCCAHFSRKKTQKTTEIVDKVHLSLNM